MGDFSICFLEHLTGHPTYLLSKDGHSNTQVVPLLTYNQK